MKLTSCLTLLLALTLDLAFAETKIRFIPTDIEIKDFNITPHTDNRFLKVNDFGELIYQDVSGLVKVQRQGNKLTLTDCKDAPATVHLSTDGSRALFECSDGYTFVANFKSEDYEKHVVRTVGAGVSKNSYDPSIAAKNGTVLNMHPHVTSRPRQGEARFATSTGNDNDFPNYRLSYFDQDELGRVKVKAFSPNGKYALLSGVGQQKFVMDLSDQSYRQIKTEEQNFSLFSLLSNDGSTVVSQHGNNGWFCRQTLGIWRVNSGPVEIKASVSDGTNLDCVSAQDMTASGSVVLALSHHYLMPPRGHIWTKTSGQLKTIESFILQYGGQIGSWTNLIPLSISEDGLTIAGVGTDPDGKSNRVFLLEIDHLEQCDVQY